MKRGRISPRWSALPLLLWLVTSVGAIAVFSQSGDYRHATTAKALYDSGTRAALAGKYDLAVLDLRRAQRRVPGFLPIGQGPGLGARIDANLAEVRSRVMTAPSAPAAGADAAPSPQVVPQVKPAASLGPPQRPTADRLLAAVRSVTWPTRVLTAALLTGLLAAVAATRSLRFAAGKRLWPMPAGAGLVALLAFASILLCAVDRVVDSRRVEAVVVSPSVPRSGPDDLTYPPAAAAALRKGQELRVLETNEDGRWVRASLGGAPAQGSSSFWLPRGAIERID